MRTGGVSINDVFAEGGRLTGAFHLSEDQIAVSTLKRSQLPKAPLQSLVCGRGIFRGPIFSRRYVEDPAFGEPYVSAKDLVTASVRPSAYLSRSHGKLLNELRLREGMVLVTCSGMNLGRAIWGRQDLDGLVGSHDLIRVCPDADVVPPGYLHAFLSGRYGHSFIRKQIYGGNIKHVEPAHLANLPVPRIGDKAERAAHRLVEQAASQRSEAARVRRTILGELSDSLGWGSPRTACDLYATASSLDIQRRLDAFHHGSGVRAARERLAAGNSQRLGDVVEDVFEPSRGARRKVEDPACGVPFLSSSQVFRLDPVGDYLVSRDGTPHLQRQLVTDRDLLLPRSGQLGGIIGRAVLPLPTYYGSAASEHLVRVRCRTREDAYFAWAVLSTEPGYYAAIGTAFGSSIPSLDCALLAELRIPWWTGKKRDNVVSLVDRMVNDLADGIRDERAAVALVERTIEEAA